MEDQGYLTAAAGRARRRRRPAVLSAAAAARAGGAFADWVMSSGPEFLTRKTTEDVEVLTTFDPRVQRAAEAALAAVFETKLKAGSNAQAAIVVMSPDGAVRAMVGGRDLGAGEGQFNRATQALRQTGSLFKPFVYAAALQSGANPYDPVLDAPLTLYIPGSGEWSPQNYTREYRGQITLTQALAQSINTATVRVSEATGRARVAGGGAGLRHHRADRRRPGAGARRLRGDAARDDRRLCRLPQPAGSAPRPTGCARSQRKSDGTPLMQGGAAPRRCGCSTRRRRASSSG